MSDYAYVSLTLAIALQEARDNGLDIPAKDEVEYAKDDFLEYLDSLNREEIWRNCTATRFRKIAVAQSVRTSHRHQRGVDSVPS